MRSEAPNDGLGIRKMSRPAVLSGKNQLPCKDAPSVNPASARLWNNSHRIRLQDRGGAVRQRLAGACKPYRHQVQFAKAEPNPGELSGRKSLPETAL